MGLRHVSTSSLLLATLVLAGCGSQAGSSASSSSAPSADGGAPDPSLVGSWKIASAMYYWDAGGGDSCASGSGPYCPSAGQPLVLGADGSWSLGSSGGAWTTAAIDGSDWTRWAVSSYGPTEKVVLNGWNGGVADGPIETSGGTPQFVWVIYHVQQPSPATVYLKYGR